MDPKSPSKKKGEKKGISKLHPTVLQCLQNDHLCEVIYSFIHSFIQTNLAISFQKGICQEMLSDW
jgi:hypothetical protein